MSSQPYESILGPPPVSRRQMLELTGMGLGSLALSSLLQHDGLLAAPSKQDNHLAFNLLEKQPHFQPRAKAVLLLMQNGGPSQMDLFDPKPVLQKYSGKRHQEALKDSTKVEMFGQGNESNTLLASPFKFQCYGECGMEFSEVIPSIARLADELCVVRSMHTGHANHTEALIMFTSGKIFQGRPSFGAWISYALGTENQNLPAYIVLRDPAGYNTSGTLTWNHGWLPALYGGTEFSSQGSPVLNLKPWRQLPVGVQRENLAFLQKLNRRQQREDPRGSDQETRIQNYELAARMQLAASDIVDVSNETAATQKLYGLDRPATKKYGLRCLMARKLIEAGVRFVQVHPGVGQPWDQHNDLYGGLKSVCEAQDLPTAGLIRDLKQRGLLDDTIVLWSGEFGRLPISQAGTGRDHNRNAFSLFLAGGGFKAGHVYGETDEVGYRSVVNRVSVSDLHALLLHQLGIDHEQLTYHHSGRDESLTDPSLTGAKIHRELLA